MKNKLCTFFILVLCILAGCQKQDTVLTDVNTPQLADGNEIGETQPIAYADIRETVRKVQHPYTGVYIPEDKAIPRPMAFVINNLTTARPQSGISQADIFYEVLAEGDITRIIAVFTNFSSEKIGPIRSARHYFLDFAFDQNAMFVHHGGSPQGYSEIRRLGVDNLDGMSLEGRAFWRDPERIRQAGMYEHSSYTGGKAIRQAAENYGYNLENNDYNPMFEFYEELFVLPQGGTFADRITVPFSANYRTVFTYDEKKEQYLKWNGDTPHMDEENNMQIMVSNVLIQFVDMHVIAGDDAGRREVNLVGSGEGYLSTGGVFKPVTWTKSSHQSPTKWFDQYGNPLSLNQGKTWICVYGDRNGIIFENTNLGPENGGEDQWENSQAPGNN